MISIFHDPQELVHHQLSGDNPLAILDLSDAGELTHHLDLKPDCSMLEIITLQGRFDGEGNHSAWNRKFVGTTIYISTDPLETCKLHMLFTNDAAFGTTTCRDILASFVKWLNRPTFILVGRVPTELTKAVMSCVT